MDEKTHHKVQHQKSYPVEFKLQVLDWYYSNGKNKLKTATHFNIHTKRIRDWELNEAFLRAHSDSPRRRFRMEKAAADTYGNIGKALFQWYVEEKAVGTEHTFGHLKNKAVQLATEQNAQESFTVSDSWVRRWKKKYGVEDCGGSNRRSSRVCKSVPSSMGGAGVCEEGVVEVDTGPGNMMDTGEHGEMITIPAMLHVEAETGGESIVYVSEPQSLAHTSEEVIDMVENPVNPELVQPLSDAGTLQQTVPVTATTPLVISEPVEIQAQSITLGSTLLEHILMSLNETKKKLDQQEELTKQALQRAEEAEKEIRECKGRLTILELAAMQQQTRGSNGSSSLSLAVPDSLISPSSISLALPLISNVSTITVPISLSSASTSAALSDMTPSNTNPEDTS